MALPFFYFRRLEEKQITLDEDTSRHMISVLRMQKGEYLHLTDGEGRKARAVIVDDHRKKCVVQVEELTTEAPPSVITAVGISLVRNSSRFEWFLEKATEVGTSEIIPLICERTTKEKFRFDRMQQILVSAMLQSQQCWLPALHQPLAFEQAPGLAFDHRFIAHCEETGRRPLQEELRAGGSRLILIGPEGDFSPAEISLALDKGCIPVALGNTRLRTETAGIVAATLLRLLP